MKNNALNRSSRNTKLDKNGKPIPKLQNTNSNGQQSTDNTTENNINLH